MKQEQPPVVHLSLIGLMSVTAGCGADLTPRGARARALLAILAMSQDMKRSRRWIEGLLWSSRDPKQAGASLRQTLSEIRRSTKSVADILIADRSSVKLNDAIVKVDVLDRRAEGNLTLPSGTEFLEGLDIADPAFTNWIAEQRQGLSQAQVPHRPQNTNLAPPPGKARLIVSPDATGSRSEDAIANALGRQIARSVLDSVRVDISVSDGGMPQTTVSDIRLAPLILDHGKSSMVSMELSQVARGDLLWSDALSLDVSGPPILTNTDVIAAANQAAEEIAVHVVQTEQDASSVQTPMGLLNEGITEMFSMDAQRMHNADALFAAIDGAEEEGLANAWRSMLGTIQVVERTATDIAARREEAEMYLVRAMDARPVNATVLALSSQIINLLNLPGYDSLAIAQAAVTMSRWNPMAKLSLGLAQMRQGDFDNAYRTIGQARGYAARLRNKHWWDMCFALSALATGRIDEAISAAEASMVFHPMFRPPMRHLYALYLYKGRNADAEAILKRMRKLEPDFSLRMMREDPQYPAVTIRRTRLVTQDDIVAV